MLIILFYYLDKEIKEGRNHSAVCSEKVRLSSYKNNVPASSGGKNNKTNGLLHNVLIMFRAFKRHGPLAN